MFEIDFILELHMCVHNQTIDKGKCSFAEHLLDDLKEQDTWTQV